MNGYIIFIQPISKIPTREFWMRILMKIGIYKVNCKVLIKNGLLLMKRKCIEIGLLLCFFNFFEEFASRKGELLVGWVFVLGVVCLGDRYLIVVLLNKR